MVGKVKCDLCGAEANAKYVVKKEFDGKVMNFCCRGCLQVYEMTCEENSLKSEQEDKKNGIQDKR
jgi:hypothetical protein